MRPRQKKANGRPIKFVAFRPLNRCFLGLGRSPQGFWVIRGTAAGNAEARRKPPKKVLHPKNRLRLAEATKSRERRGLGGRRIGGAAIAPQRAPACGSEYAGRSAAQTPPPWRNAGQGPRAVMSDRLSNITKTTEASPNFFEKLWRGKQPVRMGRCCVYASPMPARTRAASVESLRQRLLSPTSPAAGADRRLQS